MNSDRYSRFKEFFKKEEDFQQFLKDEEDNNRGFTRRQKHVCWHMARDIPGRDPNRWKFDNIGNPVLERLRGCFGALCHEYDHIAPYSKGGRTEVYNCQLLQTGVNRFKSNKTDLSERDLQTTSKVIGMTDDQMDLIEFAIYGNVTTEDNYAPHKI